MKQLAQGPRANWLPWDLNPGCPGPELTFSPQACSLLRAVSHSWGRVSVSLWSPEFQPTRDLVLPHRRVFLFSPQPSPHAGHSGTSRAAPYLLHFSDTGKGTSRCCQDPQRSQSGPGCTAACCSRPAGPPRPAPPPPPSACRLPRRPHSRHSACSPRAPPGPAGRPPTR